MEKNTIITDWLKENNNSLIEDLVKQEAKEHIAYVNGYNKAKEEYQTFGLFVFIICGIIYGLTLAIILQ